MGLCLCGSVSGNVDELCIKEVLVYIPAVLHTTLKPTRAFVARRGLLDSDASHKKKKMFSSLYMSS